MPRHRAKCNEHGDVIWAKRIYRRYIASFLQSDEMARKGKVVVALPSYIELPDPRTLKMDTKTGPPIVTEKDVIIVPRGKYSEREVLKGRRVHSSSL